MEQVREREVKLQVPPAFVLPDLSSVGQVHGQPVAVLRATYWDSADLRLARAGITLRHRTGEAAARWTLKLPVASTAGLDRTELSVDREAGQVPEQLRDLVTARLRGAELVDVAVVRTRRTLRRLLDEDGLLRAEVVDDHVAVLRGSRTVQSWRELEVEQVGDDDAMTTAAVRLLVAAGASAGEQVSKAVRALGAAAAQHDLPPVVRVRRKDPAGALVRASLRDGLARIVREDPGVRLGRDDAVHQVRVACRRLRSDLRTFRPLLDDERVALLREELRWLADAFGGARDLEVLRARLRRTAVADPLSPVSTADVDLLDSLLAGEEQAAVSQALTALRSERYVALLDLLLAIARSPGLSDAALERCDRALPALVGHTWRQLAKRVRRLDALGPDDVWHRTRVLAKRARYAAETAELALGKRARPTARAAKRVQELLGEHQDAVVAADRVLALAVGSPALGITCGQLAERERAAVRQLRRDLPAVWHQASRPRTTAWIG